MTVKPKSFSAYGLEWPNGTTSIAIHVYCIRNGGLFKDANGKNVGAPLFNLYREMQTLLWGERCEHHDWSDLMLKTILENRITTVQGPHDSGKTHVMARYALVDYFCFPKETLILMSSTDLRGLELRVWGEVKELFNLARESWPEAPGTAVDSMHGIFTDEIGDNGDARDIRRGLICIPVLDSDNQWKGIQKWVGVKQKRRRMLADETQFYASPFLDTLANINKQRSDFKGVFVGNPIGDGDPLDKLAEPMDGWSNLPEINATTTWKNRMGGITIQLLGSDSPAIRFPGKYGYLIDQSDIDYVESYWGRESSKWWNQVLGMRPPSIDARRVITRDLVDKFGAQKEVIWGVGEIITVYAVDAGYGGDRCIGGEARFGKDINGKLVISLGKPRSIPVRMYPKSTPAEDRIPPEDQIAEYVKADCERLGIPSANVFHDSTGRGSLGSAFARLWRHDTNPVEFGGSPTPRPVLADLFIYDEKLKKKRLQRCDEHYVKRVSELHYSVRYVIEGKQMRDLPNDVRDELCIRNWDRVKGDKIEVEGKEETKDRFGRSPDLADWCFSGDTKILTPYGNISIRTLLPGDIVVTPMGHRRINKVSVNFVETITETTFSNGSMLSGRGEHPVYTWDSGWVRLADLSLTNEVESAIHLPLWEMQRRLSTNEEPTGFRAAEDTIRTTTGRVRRSDFFTDEFGQINTDPFHLVSAFITEMGTGVIIALRTWNSWVGRLTPQCTFVNAGRSPKNEGFSSGS